MVEFPTSGPAAFYFAPSPAAPYGLGIKGGEKGLGGVLQGAAPGDAQAAKSTMAEENKTRKPRLFFGSEKQARFVLC